MNSHKNARLAFEGRKLLIERIAVMGLIPTAEAAGINQRTARAQGLLDRTSRPQRTRTTLDAELIQCIGRLRRKHMALNFAE